VNSLRYEVFVNDGVRRERDMRLPERQPHHLLAADNWANGTELSAAESLG
jgi:hypothetical protein